MSLSTRQQGLKQKLIQDGSQVAALSTADLGRKPFDEFLDSIHTRDLLLILNHCLVSEPLPEPVKRLFKYILAILPLRPNGVRDVFEFVVAVHPSTQGPEGNASNEKNTRRRGPGITPDALYAATRLISSPPSFVTPRNWFSGIAPQLLNLLDGADDKELANVAAYMIGSILGPEKYGKPGREGWVAFAQPILENIAPPSKKVSLNTSGSRILVDSASLSQALERLETLTNSHPNPGLTTRLLRPIRLPLWAIASWSLSSNRIEEMCLKPAKRLLQTYLKLEHGIQSFSALQRIVQNLMFTKLDWKYELGEAGLLQVVKSQILPSLDNSRATEIDLGVIDHAIDFLVTILSDTTDIRGIPDLFLELLRKWMKTSETIAIRVKSSTEDWESKYIETKLIQEMLDKIPEKLISDSSQILEFVYEFLDIFVKSQEKGKVDDEATDQATLILSLLHIVLSSQGFKTPSFQAKNSNILSRIEPLLEKLANSRNTISDDESTVSDVARNLLHFLIWRDQPAENLSSTTLGDKYADDLKQRDLAMSYLTSLTSPPPVLAEGLSLLTNLITTSSPVLSIPSTLHLLCTLLQSPEEYIYLSTIKTLVKLSTHHPKTVLSTLLEKYLDTDELLLLDTRLRLGEALTNILQAQTQNTKQNFSSPTMKTLGTTLLHIASLRPQKIQTAKKLTKEKRLAAAKEAKAAKEADEAWGGSVPDLEDIITSKSDQADIETLQKILDGWSGDGKRVTEDIRIRTSALSIFSTELNINVSGFETSTIAEAVDLSLMILKLERGDEAAILRRAAILLVLGLVRGLDEAVVEGRKTGFVFEENSVGEIREVLGYVAATDGDGLVRQHASDVRESLGNFRDKGLLELVSTSVSGGRVDLVEGGLGAGLRGLSVNPGVSSGVGGGGMKRKPIIEEIE